MDPDRDSIACPKCWCCDTRIANTRPIRRSLFGKPGITVIRRYRQCRACGHKFPTVEQYEKPPSDNGSVS